MNSTPMAKRSKRAQREHYAAKRGSWNGLSPVTRVMQSKKTYDRNRVKREAAAQMTCKASIAHRKSQKPPARAGGFAVDEMVLRRATSRRGAVPVRAHPFFIWKSIGNGLPKVRRDGKVDLYLPICRGHRAAAVRVEAPSAGKGNKEDGLS